jgi:type I restriction enzyme S subunit
MLRNEFKNKLLSMVGSSTLKAINKANLRSIKISLPCFEEQIKIANFLSSIDSKIEQVGGQLDESKQFKKALLQQMFV